MMTTEEGYTEVCRTVRSFVTIVYGEKYSKAGRLKYYIVLLIYISYGLVLYLDCFLKESVFETIESLGLSVANSRTILLYILHYHRNKYQLEYYELSKQVFKCFLEEENIFGDSLDLRRTHFDVNRKKTKRIRKNWIIAIVTMNVLPFLGTFTSGKLTLKIKIVCNKNNIS